MLMNMERLNAKFPNSKKVFLVKKKHFTTTRHFLLVGVTFLRWLFFLVSIRNSIQILCWVIMIHWNFCQIMFSYHYRAVSCMFSFVSFDLKELRLVTYTQCPSAHWIWEKLLTKNISDDINTEKPVSVM